MANNSHVSFTEHSDSFASDPPTVDDAAYWAGRAEAAANNAATSETNSFNSAQDAAQSALEAEQAGFDVDAAWVMNGAWTHNGPVTLNNEVSIVSSTSRAFDIQLQNQFIDRDAIVVMDYAGVDRWRLSLGADPLAGSDYPQAFEIGVNDDGLGMQGMLRISKANGVEIYRGGVWVELTGGGGGGSFDPSADQNITGNWDFQGTVSGDAPSLPAHLATKSYVDTEVAANAFDPSASEVITGGWTFSNPLLVSAPIVDGHAATKLYVDTEIAGVGGFDPSASQTITGSWTFTNPVVGASPSLVTHLATKGYVDGVLPDVSGFLPKTAGATDPISSFLRIDRALATNIAGDYIQFYDNGGAVGAIQKRTNQAIAVMNAASTYIAQFQQDNTVDFAGQIRARGGEPVRLIGGSTGDANLAYMTFYESDGATRQGFIGKSSGLDNSLRLRNEQVSGRIVIETENSLGTNRAMIEIEDDFTTEPRVALKYGGSNVLLTSDPGTANILSGVRVADGNGTFRGAGFLESAKFNLSGTLTMGAQYAGHTVYISGGAGAAIVQFNFESTLPIGTWFNVVTGSNACSIQSNSGSVTVRWLQGGTFVDRGSGSSFTVAAGSMVTCWKFSDSFWFISGNGIS